MVVNLKTVSKLLGPAMLGIGLLALIPATVAIYFHTAGMLSFATAFVICLCLSFFLHLYSKNAPLEHISIRELFLFTSTLWILTTLIAAIPFWVMLEDISYTAAIFEAASGISTTGATAIVNLDTRPASILLWRSMLQFIGGIGFVAIAVAVLPNVALGGMNIFKTESTYFDSSSKITAHMKTMSFAVLGWYLVLLISCTIALNLGEMDFFTALNTAMCTVSTGGMMITDSSMNGFSPYSHYVAIIFMILGALPFLLTLSAISGNIKQFIKDDQIKGFFVIVFLASLAVTISLMVYNNYDLEKAIRVSLFNVVSVITTTGFSLEDFSDWNHFATLIFLIILGIGGCSGSTSGGIKTFRFVVGFSMFKSQIVKSIHPHGVIEPRFNGQRVNSETLRSIITFIVAYVLALLISSAIATLLGLPLSDAITATITTLSNTGPALGPNLGPSGNYASLSYGLHLLFAFDMILGRLEIIPVILCVTRVFWRY